MTTLQKIRDAFYSGRTYFIRHKSAIYECRAKKYKETTEFAEGFKTVSRILTVEIPSHDGKTELELTACDYFSKLEDRREKIIIFDNVAAAIANNEKESLAFPLRCDAEIAKCLGLKFIEPDIIGSVRNPLKVSAYIWDGYVPRELYPGFLSIESIEGSIMRIAVVFGNEQKLYATYNFSDTLSEERVCKDGWYSTEEDVMKDNQVKIIMFEKTKERIAQ